MAIRVLQCLRLIKPLFLSSPPSKTWTKCFGWSNRTAKVSLRVCRATKQRRSCFWRWTGRRMKSVSWRSWTALSLAANPTRSNRGIRIWSSSSLPLPNCPRWRGLFIEDWVPMSVINTRKTTWPSRGNSLFARRRSKHWKMKRPSERQAREHCSPSNVSPAKTSVRMHLSPTNTPFFFHLVDA